MKNTFHQTSILLLLLSLNTSPAFAGFLEDARDGVSRAAGAVTETVKETVNNTVSTVSNETNKVLDNVEKTGHKAVADTGATIDKGLKDAGREVGKGLKDVVAEAGRVYEHNTESFIAVGRASACMYTMCMSELYRMKKIEHEQKKAKDKLEEFKENDLNAYKNRQGEAYIAELKRDLRSLKEMKKQTQKSNQELSEMNEINTQLLGIIDAETKIRAEYASIQEKVVKADGVTTEAVQAFQQKIRSVGAENVDIKREAALRELAKDLLEIGKTKSRKIEELSAEALRNMDNDVLTALKEIKAKSNNKAASLIQAQKALEAEIDARIQLIHQELLKNNVQVEE